MTILSDDQIKYARYKWEFLRRNPEYIKDWQKLEDTLFKKYEDYYPPTGEQSKEEIEFCKKWEIACQLYPEYSYEDFTTGINESFPFPNKENDEINGIDFESLPYAVSMASLTSLGLDVDRIMFDRLFPEFIYSRPVMAEDGWEYEYDRDGNIFRRSFSDEVAKRGILTVKIDLNHSKNRLINDFKDFIDKWKKMYEKAFINFQYYKFCKEREIRSHPIKDEDTKKSLRKFMKID